MATTSLNVPSPHRPARAASGGWAHGAELVYLLVLKDFRVRYKRSFLGYIWAVANPLAFTLVYYVAFKIIMRVDIENYPLFLVTGLFPWAWVSNALLQATVAFRGNASLVRKVQVNRAVLPLGNVLQEMLHFFFASPIIIGAVILSTGHGYWSWIVLIPVMACVQLAVIYPVGLLLASANVIVRDIEYLLAIGLQLLFFLTPVVYEDRVVAGLPPNLRAMLLLNPVRPIIAAWRDVFLRGTVDPWLLGQCLLFAASAALVAFLVYRRVEPRIGELL